MVISVPFDTPPSAGPVYRLSLLVLPVIAIFRSSTLLDFVSTVYAPWVFLLHSGLLLLVAACPPGFLHSQFSGFVSPAASPSAPRLTHASVVTSLPAAFSSIASLRSAFSVSLCRTIRHVGVLLGSSPPVHVSLLFFAFASAQPFCRLSRSLGSVPSALVLDVFCYPCCVFVCGICCARASD